MVRTAFDCLKLRAARLLKFRTARALARREDGAAAVEFAMVAAPFLALIFAILETAFVFLSGQVLESAATASSRLIMTGQAQTQGLSQAAFKEKVCSHVVALFDCSGGVYVDVKTYKSFASANLAKPLDGDGNLVKDFTYQPGEPGDIVVVRLLYEFPAIASLLGHNLSDMAGNKRLIVATVAFRNEPYK